MIRRTFLKSLAAVPFLPSPGRSPAPRPDYPHSEPLTFFEPVYFEPGTRIEFPLEFWPNKVPTCYFIPDTHAHPEKHDRGGSLRVPTFDAGGSGKTPEAACLMLDEKLNKAAFRLLLCAAKGHENFPGTDEPTLRGHILDHFRGGPVGFVKRAGWLIGVDTRAAGNCVMPYRIKDRGVFADPLLGYWTFGEQGMVVFDHTRLVCGKITDH